MVEHGAELPDYREPIEASPANPPYERFPLTLLFSHSRHRIHSSFANLPKLELLAPEPFADIHPADAAPRAITDRQRVRVYNQRGAAGLKARPSADLKLGVVVISGGKIIAHASFEKARPWVNLRASAKVWGCASRLSLPCRFG